MSVITSVSEVYFEMLKVLAKLDVFAWLSLDICKSEVTFICLD